MTVSDALATVKRYADGVFLPNEGFDGEDLREAHAALQSRIAELERDAARLGPSDRQAKWELAASLLVELGEPGLASSARGHAIIERMVEEKRRG